MRKKSYISLLLLAVFNLPGHCLEDPECLWNNFKCQEGHCIFSSWVCDGKPDCENGKDEAQCGSPCGNNYFRCNNGTCIQHDKVCNGRKDCSEGEEENNCGNICYGSEFQCTNGQCISGHQQVCDGKKDCRDGSDEFNCEGPRKCFGNNFICSNGTCINKNFVCDGENDCPDGGDEKNCTYPSTCPPDQVTCSDTRCAANIWLCFTSPENNSENSTISKDENEQCLLVHGCIAKVIGLAVGILGLLLIIFGWSFWFYKEKVAQAGDSNYRPLGRSAARNTSSEAFTMDNVP